MPLGAGLGTGAAAAQDDPSVLFIRGAERSGGFLAANNNNTTDEDAARTAQLADINDNTVGNNPFGLANTGFGELNTLLTSNGFDVSQAIEPLLPGDPPTGQTEGGPLNFGAPQGANFIDFNDYDVVVFGSNNATYTQADVDAFETYIRGGGAAIFFSDANFGDNFADAPDSDQPSWISSASLLIRTPAPTRSAPASSSAAAPTRSSTVSAASPAKGSRPSPSRPIPAPCPMASPSRSSPWPKGASSQTTAGRAAVPTPTRL